MSLLSKVVSFAFLASTLVTDSLEKSMTKAKSKSRRTTASSGSKSPVQAFNAEKATAKRAVAEAGRATLAMAQFGARRTADAGRDVLARATRSAAGGLRTAAQGLDESLRTVADRVMPAGRK